MTVTLTPEPFFSELASHSERVSRNYLSMIITTWSTSNTSECQRTWKGIYRSMRQCPAGGGWSRLSHWVPWPKMLYNYPRGEDMVASSGLGTHRLRGSEIAGAPPLNYTGLPERVTGCHICVSFLWLPVAPTLVLSLNLSRRTGFHIWCGQWLQCLVWISAVWAAAASCFRVFSIV